ncbi:MAG: tRNA pseudouridine(13) synthase TruD [Planctomycetia bacterium]|nr:tRNA pseudouridine(13) synthase TruD [Planctomycetia bacterium]MCC7313601.1 tRNA pseudouridine(13) synthase TruD [Planctomycetota bacterium]
MSIIESTSPTDTLPFLTADVPAMPGAIKRRYEDFLVEEIPAYQPCGSGDHIYFTIEKRGLATMRAIHDIGRALGVQSRDIGLAGLKDARAITVQTLSIEHIDPKKVASLDIPRIRVLSVSRHGNKLRIGHLRGNRFRIKMRDCDPGRFGDLESVLETLRKRGVPNYFGSQRFGSRGDTGTIGRAVLQRDAGLVMDLMLGKAGPHDTGEVLRARQLYDSGEYEAAAKAWPYGFRDNARACRAMARSGGKHKRAFHAIDQRLRKFFVSAYQSELFNRCLAQRLDQLDRVMEGDLAFKHENGSVFLVMDAAAEAPRAASFEISPTGPIFGARMTCAQGEPGRVEKAILDAEQIDPDDFRAVKGMKIHGSRRPLRFAMEDLRIDRGSDDHGAYVELAFALDAGCYATTILREICKNDLQEGLNTEGGVDRDAATAEIED